MYLNIFILKCILPPIFQIKWWLCFEFELGDPKFCVSFQAAREILKPKMNSRVSEFRFWTQPSRICRCKYQTCALDLPNKSKTPENCCENTRQPLELKIKSQPRVHRPCSSKPQNRVARVLDCSCRCQPVLRHQSDTSSCPFSKIPDSARRRVRPLSAHP